MPTLGDLLLGRQSGGLLDLMKQYGAGVKQRVGLLADDPAEFARQALLDVVPNRAEAQAAQARVMGGSLDPQAYSGYLGKMQDLGGLLGSIKSMPADDIAVLVGAIEQSYPGIKLDLYKRGDNALELSRIVVPKEARNSGIGTSVMRSISDYADKNGLRIDLSPSSDFGGNLNRLREFYRRFGFIDNKGRGRDFEISAAMYRNPSGKK